MKKWTALLVALLLPFAAASAQTYTASTYYTIDYPDTLTLDDTSYKSDSTEDYLWLFLLDGGTYYIDASISTADGYEGFSLFNATEEEKQAYLDDSLADFADQNATFADIITTDGGIPFYVFSMKDSDGPYYFAETIANGSSISFCCYYEDISATPDAPLLSHLKTVLKTFRPVTQSAGDA